MPFYEIYSVRSDVRTFLAEQLQELSNEEQKKWLSNITSHIQSQGLPTPNVEIKHIELAIKVSCNSILILFRHDPILIFHFRTTGKL